jgi:D-alanyl-D-alanine carboxypeptidase
VRTRLVICCLAALAIAAALSTPAALASAKQRDAQLDSALQQLVQMPLGPPGVVAAVQRGNDFKLHTAGVAEVGTASPIRARDHLRAASVAKAFSGAVALRLVSKRRLSLDDTVGLRLPGLPAAWSSITLRQLLQHTSGLPSFPDAPGFQAYLGAHLTDYTSPLFAISFVFDDPLLFAPGTTYHYSNTDNIVVGLMTQAATGRSYEQNLADLVLGPLKLGDTSLPSAIGIPLPFAHGYDRSPDEPPEDISTAVSPSSAWASGAIVSTPRDLIRFVRGYGGGELFGKGVRSAQLRLVDGDSDPPGPGDNDAGLAIFRYQTGCGTVFGHTGNIPGYTNFIGVSKNGQRSVAVTATTQVTPVTGSPPVFAALRAAEELAVCAALAKAPEQKAAKRS